MPTKSASNYQKKMGKTQLGETALLSRKTYLARTKSKKTRPSKTVTWMRLTTLTVDRSIGKFILHLYAKAHLAQMFPFLPL